MCNPESNIIFAENCFWICAKGLYNLHFHIPLVTGNDYFCCLILPTTSKIYSIIFLKKEWLSVPRTVVSNFSSTTCNPQFGHFRKLFALEEQKVLKVAHKLKKSSLNPSNIARASPQHALTSSGPMHHIRCKWGT